MDRPEVTLNRRAVESLIDGTVPILDAIQILIRSVFLAEDFLLATGSMRPDEKGILWAEAKSCFISLKRPDMAVGIRTADQARRLREIAAIADEDLTMDPWVSALL